MKSFRPARNSGGLDYPLKVTILGCPLSAGAGAASKLILTPGAAPSGSGSRLEAEGIFMELDPFFAVSDPAGKPKPWLYQRLENQPLIPTAWRARFEASPDSTGAGQSGIFD